MMQLSTRRSSPGRRLQMPVESSCAAWNGAIGEVDTGAAQARFEVEIGSGTHVSLRRRCELATHNHHLRVGHQHGIVEITRCFAVDGDDR